MKKDDQLQGEVGTLVYFNASTRVNHLVSLLIRKEKCVTKNAQKCVSGKLR